MIVHFKWSALKQGRWYEHVIRFGLGGLTTVLAGAVAQRYGPTTGGLFLAFPAILCASATLIEKHERKRKEAKGLQGARRGQQAAALDATGAGWGSMALGVFGLCVWWLAPASSFGSLCAAAIGWLVVAISAWELRRRLRRGDWN
jgi:uncharacterized membrane protein YfcA